MEFVVMGHDGTDEGALARRMAARPAHLELGQKSIADGSMLYAAALLDDNEKMIGSMLVVNYPSRAALDAWLKVEPYVTGDVWRRVEVLRCRPAVKTQIVP